MTIVYHNFKQRSDEWFKLRSGLITASKAGDYLGLNKDVDQAQAIDALRFGIKSEVNEYHCNRGGKLEPMALRDLELEKNITIREVGAYQLDNWLVGSPDGISDDKAVIEVKCPMEIPLIARLHHVAQCQVNMFLTGLKKCYLYYYTVDKGSKLFELDYDNSLTIDWLSILKRVYYMSKVPLADYEKELVKKIEAYKSIKEKIKEQEEKADAIRADIDIALGNVDKLHLKGHLAQRITKSGGYDYKKFLIDSNIKVDDNYKKPDTTYLRIS